MSRRCDFQVKLSAKTRLFECAGVDCFLISYVQSAGRQIAFVWSISLAIYSLSEKAAEDWAEMGHGFIRPPLHFTPIPFAPYYAHRTVRARACLCVCVLGCIMFCFEALCTWKRDGRSRRRKRKMREWKGKKGASIWCSHYTSCRFHLHLIVCLIAGKKSRWFTKPGEAADPFSLGTVALCVCLGLSGCVQCANSSGTSTQTTVAFACVQWPIYSNLLWQHLP